MYQPAQTVTALHADWFHLGQRLDHQPATWRCEVQAAVCAMRVVMIDEDR
jgi:hypothetical protein